jgi:hypothetical protein
VQRVTHTHQIQQPHHSAQSKTGNANDAQMDALRVTLGNFKRNHMIYFEYDQPHYFVWPVLALGSMVYSLTHQCR